MTVVTISGKPRTLMPSEKFGVAREVMLKHKNAFTWEGDSEQEIEDKISKLIDLLIFKPDHSTNFYHFEDTVRVTVKPRGKSRIKNRKMLTALTVLKDKNLYATLAEDLVNWYDEYYTTLSSVINAETFTAKVKEIAEKSKIALPFNISFDYGQGLMAATNEGIVIGLSSSVLATMETSPLFAQVVKNAEGEEAQANQLIENEVAIVAAWLQSVAEEGITAAVAKSNFTRRYGIATNEASVQVDKIVTHKLPKAVSKLRKGSNVFKGETADGLKYLAVLGVVPVSEEEASNLDADAVVVIANPNPTKAEKEENKTKCAIYFELNPIPRAAKSLEQEGVREALASIKLTDITSTIEM